MEKRETSKRCIAVGLLVHSLAILAFSAFIIGDDSTLAGENHQAEIASTLRAEIAKKCQTAAIESLNKAVNLRKLIPAQEQEADKYSALAYILMDVSARLGGGSSTWGASLVNETVVSEVRVGLAAHFRKAALSSFDKSREAIVDVVTTWNENPMPKANILASEGLILTSLAEYLERGASAVQLVDAGSL